MDRLEAMRLFTRVVDRRSFTDAAHDLDIPRSTATQVVQQLENRLGVRLLQRTTRTVRPTLDGEAYYRRCLAILDDVEDAEGAFSGAVPKGTLRVEVQGTIARHFLMPGLPQFFADYPDIEIAMSESDRWVDVVREGVDCVLRYGALPPFEFVNTQGLTRIDVPAPFSVTGTESFLDGVRLGLGLAQMPLFHVEHDLAEGRLQRLLPEHPVPSAPVSVLYPRSRQLSPRVRVFIDWIVQRLSMSGANKGSPA